MARLFCRATARRETYQALARERLEVGPPPLSEAESTQLRYALTNLLDDFDDAIDRAEFLFIATQLFVKASELALSSNNQWTGTGKWMARRLAASDPLVLERLQFRLRRRHRYQQTRSTSHHRHGDTRTPPAVPSPRVTTLESKSKSVSIGCSQFVYARLFARAHRSGAHFFHGDVTDIGEAFFGFLGRASA